MLPGTFDKAVHYLKKGGVHWDRMISSAKKLGELHAAWGRESFGEETNLPESWVGTPWSKREEGSQKKTSA